MGLQGGLPGTICQRFQHNQPEGFILLWTKQRFCLMASNS